MYSKQNKVRRTFGTGTLWCLGLLAIGLMLAPAALAADAFSLAGTEVVNAPAFSYVVAQVAFDQPRNLSTGAGAVQRLDLVKVTVNGDGFQAKATGPAVWLNGIATLRTEVSEDGRTIEAYFLETLPELENAAAGAGGWELIVQPHEGAPTAYRVGGGGTPEIRRFSAEEQAELDARKASFGVE